MDSYPGLIRGRAEAAGKADRGPAGSRRGEQLVHRWPGDLAGYLGEAAVHRDEHHVAVLQSEVAGIDAVQEVIVQVELNPPACRRGAPRPGGSCRWGSVRRRRTEP